MLYLTNLCLLEFTIVPQPSYIQDTLKTQLITSQNVSTSTQILNLSSRSSNHQTRNHSPTHSSTLLSIHQPSHNNICFQPTDDQPTTQILGNDKLPPRRRRPPPHSTCDNGCRHRRLPQRCTGFVEGIQRRCADDYDYNYQSAICHFCGLACSICHGDCIWGYESGGWEDGYGDCVAY